VTAARTVNMALFALEIGLDRICRRVVRSKAGTCEMCLGHIDGLAEPDRCVEPLSLNSKSGCGKTVRR
jgi:hypothetical protein